MLNKIGALQRARREFRANTIDHIAGATYDALRYSGKQLFTVAVVAVFAVLNKWQ